MRRVEEEARSAGYHYLYLWTTDAVAFYRRLGYSPCERVSLHKACFQNLQQGEVGLLEGMLAKRLQAAAPPEAGGDDFSENTASVRLQPDCTPPWPRG